MLSKLKKRKKIGLQNNKENMGSKENVATVIVHKNVFVKNVNMAINVGESVALKRSVL